MSFYGKILKGQWDMTYRGEDQQNVEAYEFFFDKKCITNQAEQIKA